MRTVSIRFDDMGNHILYLGYAGENKHTRVLIDCKKIFEDYPAAVPVLSVTPPNGDKYPATISREGNTVIWDVTDSDLIYDGGGEVQLTFVEDEVVAKSPKCRTKIEKSIVANGQTPTPIADWLIRAETVLEAIPEEVNAAIEEAKESGLFDGVGISSIGYVSTVGKVNKYRINLTNGQHYDFEVNNGDDGENGVGIVSIVKTGSAGLIDTYTVTLTNGQTYPITVTNGQDGSVPIDDTTPALNKVFSSEKVNNELNTVKSALTSFSDDVETIKNRVKVNGLMKGDGTGVITPAVAGTDYGTYNKPVTGIPASDLAEGVIPDVSGFYTKPQSGIPASDLAEGVIPDVSGFYTKPSGGIPSSDLSSEVKNNINGKLPIPASTPLGTVGQVLKTDGAGGTYWDTEMQTSDISNAVTTWMGANIHEDPTVVIDNSLSVSGAAADAEKVGEVKEDVIRLKGEVFETTDNLLDFITDGVWERKESDGTSANYAITTKDGIELTEGTDVYSAMYGLSQDFFGFQFSLRITEYNDQDTALRTTTMSEITSTVVSKRTLGAGTAYIKVTLTTNNWQKTFTPAQMKALNPLIYFGTNADIKRDSIYHRYESVVGGLVKSRQDMSDDIDDLNRETASLIADMDEAEKNITKFDGSVFRITDNILDFETPDTWENKEFDGTASGYSIRMKQRVPVTAGMDIYSGMHGLSQATLGENFTLYIQEYDSNGDVVKTETMSIITTQTVSHRVIEDDVVEIAVLLTTNDYYTQITVAQFMEMNPLIYLGTNGDITLDTLYRRKVSRVSENKAKVDEHDTQIADLTNTVRAETDNLLDFEDAGFWQRKDLDGSAVSFAVSTVEKIPVRGGKDIYGAMYGLSVDFFGEDFTLRIREYDSNDDTIGTYTLAEISATRVYHRALNASTVSIDVMLTTNDYRKAFTIEQLLALVPKIYLGWNENITRKTIYQKYDTALNVYANQVASEFDKTNKDVSDLADSLGTLSGNVDDLGNDVDDLSNGKVSKPTLNPDGTSGQLLRTNGDGTTTWVDAGLPTDAQTAAAVSDWMDEHPEASTSVKDGSLTKAKFSNTLKNETIKDYVTPEMYGAVADGETDDTEAITAALATGKTVVLANEYYCEDITIPGKRRIIINGVINLNGTITINMPKVAIRGSGKINALAGIAFMLYGTGQSWLNSCKYVTIEGIEITGNYTNTCIAITNTSTVGAVTFIRINCMIENFLYAVHSYKTHDNISWFTSITVDGTIENCNRAVVFDWYGDGSIIHAMIQPRVNATHTDDVPLIKISNDCIVDGMIWDMDQANNKKAIRATGIRNKINVPMNWKYIDFDGKNYARAGFITPSQNDVFYRVSTPYFSNSSKNLPIMSPYDNSNDIAYMAGTNKIDLAVSPASYNDRIISLLNSSELSVLVDAVAAPELEISLAFDEPVALREMFVTGEVMPDSVKFEYKNASSAWVKLCDRVKGTDYSDTPQMNSYAFWQFEYESPAAFLDKYAYGVRITMAAEENYRISRIFVGIANVLFANKFGDDLVATSLKLKSGDKYYTITIDDGQIVATEE